MRSSRATSLALIASLAQGSLALAQPTQVQTQAAGDLVKKAIARSQAGDHTLAIELYQQAYTLIPQPILLSNIGAEYQLAHRPAEAVTYFCKYLAAEPAGSGSQFATVQVRSLQAHLGAETEDGDVCKVKPKPTGAQGGSDTQTSQSSTTSDAPLTGTSVGPTGGSTIEEDAHPGRVLEVAGIAVAVAGGLSIALGVHFAVNGRQLSQDIDAHPAGEPWPATIDGVAIADWQTQGEAWNRDAYIFSIVGGVAIAAGATMFVIGRGQQGSTASSEHAHLVPVVAPDRAGFAVAGSF